MSSPQLLPQCSWQLKCHIIYNLFTFEEASQHIMMDFYKAHLKTKINHWKYSHYNYKVLNEKNNTSSYHSIDDFSKYHMFAVQPGGLGQGDKELRAIGVRPGIGHADPPNAIMLQFEVLIWKRLTINAYTWWGRTRKRSINRCYTKFKSSKGNIRFW